MMLCSVAVTATDTHRTIDAVWRIEQAKLIAGLARIARVVGVAEELAQDAFIAVLEQWPKSGIPNNPGAWLMAAAKYRAIDRLRRSKLVERKHEGDLLAKLSRLNDARAEFERAASLTRNERERNLLLDRATACART